MRILALTGAILLLLAGCGYKPVAQYAKEVLGERIYVDIAINLRDPENSVLIKDALSQAIMTRLHGKLASKESADSTLRVILNSANFTSLADNKEGFTTFYRAQVSLGFAYEDKEGKARRFNSIGRYDFSIDDSSILSDSKRFEAIKSASIQAIDHFISHIAMQGAKGVQP